MKKSILSIVAIATFSLSSFSQIPNAGFETWTTTGAYSTPDGWATMNPTTDANSVYTATKGTPGSPGSSYLKLTSRTVNSTVVNGIAVSGELNTNTLQPISGFPCTDQPVSFTGKWQHMIYGSSQGSISVTLTKWNTNTLQRDVIATANQTLSGMAMSWANFSINFVYQSSEVPDSCIIVLKASGNNPTNNDYLWVDNLAFSGSVAGLSAENSLIQEVNVFPNPVNEQVKINLSLREELIVNLELIDNNGKISASKNCGLIQGKSTQDLDVKNLEKGIYTLRIITSKGIETKEIVVQ